VRDDLVRLHDELLLFEAFLGGFSTFAVVNDLEIWWAKLAGKAKPRCNFMVV
jgi:hypothetical protein